MSARAAAVDEKIAVQRRDLGGGVFEPVDVIRRDRLVVIDRPLQLQVPG